MVSEVVQLLLFKKDAERQNLKINRLNSVHQQKVTKIKKSNHFSLHSDYYYHKMYFSFYF